MRRASSVLWAVGFVAIASSGPLSAEQNNEQRPQEKTQPPTNTRQGPAVTLTAEGNLSVTVSRVRLGALLRQISALSEVPIVVAESLANDPVTFKIRDVPLDEGLKRLLAPYDAFYLYSADDRSAGSVKTVWVYARGQGRDIEPVPSALWSSTKELEPRLEDPDPDVRADTYELLIERHGERSLPTVLKGLADPDDSVRTRTLSSAIDEDIEIPAQDLEAIILGTDQSQSMRILALQAVQGRPEAEAIAASVMNDQDEMVRNEARRILASRRPPG